MEEMFPILFEKSVTSGCLVFLLWYVVKHLQDVSSVLNSIKDTLAEMNTRITILEEKVK